MVWAVVGDAGNACDPQPTGCPGAVAYRYQMSKYEVTNAQYAEFMNAVAATDVNGLYHAFMADLEAYGGITRSGEAGSFSYTATRPDMPVHWVSFWDAARFVNWLHNGQPTGGQDSSTTEDGAYTLTPTGIANNDVMRNAGAEFFLPSEDEWHKAAYYDAGTALYFDYPAGSDTVPTCSTPGAVPNTANCETAVLDVTVVGTYSASASPEGTYDQGGNVEEWTEEITFSPPVSGRVVRGGSALRDIELLWAGLIGQGRSDESDGWNSGIRVASPAPPAPQFVPSLTPLGVGALLGLLGSAGCWLLRRNH